MLDGLIRISKASLGAVIVFIKELHEDFEIVEGICSLYHWPNSNKVKKLDVDSFIGDADT